MVPKSFLTLMVLFLCLSYVVSSAAATRSLKSYQENPISFQELHSQDSMDGNVEDESFSVGEGLFERRMDLESTDYSETGANNHHDPKTPESA